MTTRVGRLAGAVVWGCALAIAQGAAAQLPKIELDVDPVLETNAFHPGSTARVAFKMALPKGLHTNSNEPLESYLIPFSVKAEPPEGIALGQVAYPEAKMFTLEGTDEPLAVFEEEFVVGATFTIGESVAPGDYTVTVPIRFQACDDKQCFAPTTKTIELTLPVVSVSETIAPTDEALFASIAFEDATEAPDDAPDAESADDAATDAPGDSADAVETLKNEFVILGTTGGFLPVDDFIDFIDAAESGAPQSGGLEGLGFFSIVAIVLAGGLLLNLTPCVLPMIPINIAIIGAGAQAGSRTRGFMLGGAYGLAMALVYGVLGLVVVLTAGTFGAINASPWFNLGIAALFIVLALGMFDVITIDFSKWQGKMKLGGGKGSFMLAFGMGAVAALLAGACVAPVVIQVVVFSAAEYGKGNTFALALPFLLGVGMAIPWPIAGAGLSFLPKPGMWMVRVKQAFGVFILGFAIYYGHLGYTLLSDRWVDADQVAEGVEEKLEAGWYSSLEEGLAVAQAEDKKVFVDMWATWCKNCLVMDKTTFKDPAVVARMEDFVKIKVQSEDTSVSPAKDLLVLFDGIGLPTYALLEPKSE